MNNTPIKYYPKPSLNLIRSLVVVLKTYEIELEVLMINELSIN